MNEKIEALAAEIDALRAEVVELSQVEEPTDEQVARMDEILPIIDERVAEHDRMVAREEKVAAVRKAYENPKNRESGFGGGPEVIVKRSPFDGLDGIQYASPADVRARALSAIEETDEPGVPDSFREQATQLAQRNSKIAAHMLFTGSPAYRRGFEKFLQYGDQSLAMMERDEAEALIAARTAMSTTAGNGGYLIPFLLDPTIVLTNDGSTNPFRAISRVETGTSNKWNGVTSAGVTAEWKTEGSAAADASPTFTQPSITAFLADAYVLGSYEAFQDTNIAAQLPRLIQDAKDRLEATAFATGNGTTAPKGVVTAVAAVTASRVSPTTGGVFSAASEVYKVINAVPPRHRSMSSWVANYTTLNTIRSFDVYGGSSFWADLSADIPPRLVGRPVYESSAMTATVTTGSNLLLAGDFSEYLIYDRVGVSLEYVPNVMDTSTGRPTGQRGYIAWWRVGADAINPNAFRILQL